MNINTMVDKAHKNALEKGFWDDFMYMDKLACNSNDKVRAALTNNGVATRLALIHGEVSEALEALRENDFTNFQEELADIVIRVGDLAGRLRIDLEDQIEYKMEKNSKRPYKHGKEF